MEYRLNSPDVVQEELDGEVIVVHLISGSYYSLTKGGAAVWKRLIGGQSAAAIVAHLVETTLGSPAEVATAVEQFVADLVTEQLIVAVTDAGIALPVVPAAGESCERGAFPDTSATSSEPPACGPSHGTWGRNWGDGGGEVRKPGPHRQRLT